MYTDYRCFHSSVGSCVSVLGECCFDVRGMRKEDCSCVSYQCTDTNKWFCVLEKNILSYEASSFA